MPARLRLLRASLALLPLLALVPGATAGAAPGAPWRDRLAASLGLAPGDVTLAVLAAPAPDASAISLALPLDGVPRTLRLERHSIRGPHFRVIVQGAGGAWRETDVAPPDTWRGTVDGLPGSRVFAARVAGEWHVSVGESAAEDSRTWRIEPLAARVAGAPAGVSWIARAADATSVEGTCGAAAVEPPAMPTREQVEGVLALSPVEMLACEIACDADSEFFAANGQSVPATVADIEAVLAGASAIYERDLQVTFQLGTVLVRTAEPDPYDTTNPDALLGEVRNEWRTNQSGVPRDVVHFFTGKDLAGTVVGIAYVSGLCGTYDAYGLVQSRYSTDLAMRVVDSAHEIAHNFSGSHCDYGDWPCRILCASLGHCSGGIRSFGVGELPGLRAFAATRLCFARDTLDVAHAALPFAEAFAGTTPDPARWTAVDRATVNAGRLQLNHYAGYGSDFYLGTARTLPIVLGGRADVSFRLMPYSVPSGQRLKFEYWNSARGAWVLLQSMTAPGGIPSGYTTYTYALGDSVAGGLFALRWTAYGNSGASGANWYLDDVSITENFTDAPPPGNAPLRATARPNPFAGPVRVAFELASGGPVSLEVLDAAGRRVRTLARGEWIAGRHQAEWDGRDEAGRAVPAGVYLVRLRSGPQERLLWVVHVR